MWRGLVRAALKSDEAFAKELRSYLKETGISVKTFAKKVGVSSSELYKILSGQRGNLKLDTLRKMVGFVREEGGHRKLGMEGPFIAVIAFKSVLETLSQHYVELGDVRFRVREYPVRILEDSLIAAIEAEDEGATAIVCAPVLAATLEKLVTVPIVTMHPPVDTILQAVKWAAAKLPPEARIKR